MKRMSWQDFDHLSLCRSTDTLTSAAPLLCAGVTAYGALKKVSQFLTGGKAINIIGCGGVGMDLFPPSPAVVHLRANPLIIALGHLVIMYAKAVGYRVHACKNSISLSRIVCMS